MISLSDALAWLQNTAARLQAETVPLRQAAGRILATDIAGSDGPRTAAIDGQAVRAADTEGASDYAPLPIGGTPIRAGAPMPPGTDAVLPLHLMDAGPVATASIPPGNGVQPGRDPGIPALTRLRPPHLAQLARLGVTAASVVRRPAVALHIVGPKHGPDALTPLLAALLEAEGATIKEAPPDLHLHAGRSGPGADDDGTSRFDHVHAHGIAIRPGETCAIGTIADRPAVLLPGDPLACATTFALLASPILRRLGGRCDPAPVQARLTRKIASSLGLLEAVRVGVRDASATPLGPADGTLLSAGASANGLVLVPEGSEGYPAGAIVAIYPLP